MEDCRFRCSFYVFAYFFSAIVAIVVGILAFFGILPIALIAVATLIIATLIFLVSLFAKLNACCGEAYRCHLPCCVLRHLAIESVIAIVFGILTLALLGTGPFAAIPLTIAVFAFLAALGSAIAVLFNKCNCCRNDC